MKRTLMVIIALFLIAAVPVTALADDDIYTEGTLYYTIANESVTIVGCFGRKTEVTVPASIAGYPVNTIAAGAFMGNSYLQNLNLPDTITTIEEGAIAERITVLYNCNTEYPSLLPPEHLQQSSDTPVTPADPDPRTEPVTPAQPVIPDQPYPSVSPNAPTGPAGSGDNSTENDIMDDDDTIAPSAPSGSGKTVFVDVPEGAFYSEAVAWAVENDITAGTDSTHFEPLLYCSRAQIVTFLWRAAGKPAVTEMNPFVDVTKAAWYHDAVLWAVKNGITAGVDSSHFAPDAVCDRAQIVTFLWRSVGKPSISVENRFADVSQGDWYYEAVLWAIKNNITNGIDSTHFAPMEPCNRSQAVTFQYRAAH